MMPSRIDVVLASDYAALDAGDTSLYYGYEFDEAAGDTEDAWGFSVKQGAMIVLRRSWREMAQQRGCPPVFETQACLLFGIGLWLAARSPDHA